MNARGILFYGNKTVSDSLKDYPKEKINLAGACGIWSVKDILSHLTAFEHYLEDVLTNTFIDKSAKTPYLEVMTKGNQAFNDYEYEMYKNKRFDEVLDDYNKTHNHVMKLAKKIPSEKFKEVGTIPWYGKEYSVDDFIVYVNYGHKREHTAQIDLFINKK